MAELEALYLEDDLESTPPVILNALGKKAGLGVYHMRNLKKYLKILVDKANMEKAEKADTDKHQKPAAKPSPAAKRSSRHR